MILGDKYKFQDHFNLDNIFVFVGENLHHLKKISLLSDKVFLNPERVITLKTIHHKNL